jgi:hypothetical protein
MRSNGIQTRGKLMGERTRTPTSSISTRTSTKRATASPHTNTINDAMGKNGMNTMLATTSPTASQPIFGLRAVPLHLTPHA